MSGSMTMCPWECVDGYDFEYVVVNVSICENVRMYVCRSGCTVWLCEYL